MSKVRYVCLAGEGRDIMISQADAYKIIGERLMVGWPVVQTEVIAPGGARLSVAWQLSFDDRVWCIYFEEV